MYYLYNVCCPFQCWPTLAALKEQWKTESNKLSLSLVWFLLVSTVMATLTNTTLHLATCFVVWFLWQSVADLAMLAGKASLHNFLSQEKFKDHLTIQDTRSCIIIDNVDSWKNNSEKRKKKMMKVQVDVTCYRWCITQLTSYFVHKYFPLVYLWSF